MWKSNSLWMDIYIKESLNDVIHCWENASSTIGVIED